MKLSISRNELYNKLAVVQKVIASKSAVPVAENFLFRIEGNILKIVATDLETTLSTSIDLEQDHGTLVFAMPQKIMEILKELPEQMLSFDIDEQNFKIVLKNESGTYNGDFMGVDVGKDGEDFPRPHELGVDTQEFALTSEVLLNGISRTADDRSEARRVGKECRSRWSPHH